MLLLVYFGGQRLVNLVAGALGFGPVDLSPFLAGVLSIGLLYGAYLAETFRGAYLTVPHGQTEAGLSLGMHRAPCSGRWSCRSWCASRCRATPTSGRCWSSRPPSCR